MLAHEHTYGFGSALSREVQVSRQTLSTWKAQARAALEQTFADTASTTVVTLLVEGHRSYATIQVCLRRVTGQSVSIGTIAAVVQEAMARAMAWMATHAPTSTRALALDEISANQRRGVCLRVVDSDRWAVWAAEGPLPADAERWTLVRWLAQDRGLRWQSLVTDGGEALSAAGRTVDPTRRAGRDQWPVFHTISQVQHRLARQLRTLEERTPTVARQAARIAAGKPPRGRNPTTDVAAHAAAIAHLTRTVAERRAWSNMLREALAVVVVEATGLQDASVRQAELQTALERLADLQATAPRSVHAECKRLHPWAAGGPRAADVCGAAGRGPCRHAGGRGATGPGADCLGLAAARGAGLGHRPDGGRAARDLA